MDRRVLRADRLDDEDDARMMGFGTDEQSQKMRAFFELGNKATIDSQ